MLGYGLIRGPKFGLVAMRVVRIGHVGWAWCRASDLIDRLDDLFEQALVQPMLLVTSSIQNALLRSAEWASVDLVSSSYSTQHRFCTFPSQ
jgi:hypothetical protein